MSPYPLTGAAHRLPKSEGQREVLTQLGRRGAASNPRHLQSLCLESPGIRPSCQALSWPGPSSQSAGKLKAWQYEASPELPRPQPWPCTQRGPSPVHPAGPCCDGPCLLSSLTYMCAASSQSLEFSVRFNPICAASLVHDWAPFTHSPVPPFLPSHHSYSLSKPRFPHLYNGISGTAGLPEVHDTHAQKPGTK